MPTLTSLKEYDNCDVEYPLMRSMQIIASYKTYMIRKRCGCFYLTIGKDVVAQLDTNQHKVGSKNIRQISWSCVDKKYRGKGWGKKLYKHVLDYYGMLLSDISLSGTLTGGGSAGIWMKLSSSYPSAMVGVFNDKVEPYEKRKAFGNKASASRAILIAKNKKTLTKAFGAI